MGLMDGRSILFSDSAGLQGQALHPPPLSGPHTKDGPVSQICTLAPFLHRHQSCIVAPHPSH